MKISRLERLISALAIVASMSTVAPANANSIDCGQHYSVVRGDTLTGISLRSYGSTLYQPIYAANVETIGPNPDKIYVDQSFAIPCLKVRGDAVVVDASAKADEIDQMTGDTLVFTFNKASAPPFIINSGIIDKYLAEITEVTEGRVTFVDPEVMNRKHEEQFALVTSGAVDGAYVLNSTIATSHPILQLSMLPMFGGSAEQTAVSMWRLHEAHLAQTNYFPEAEVLGFVSAPAAHIWRHESAPVTPGENVATKNKYREPYFEGLDTRGPAVVRAEFAKLHATLTSSGGEAPAYFMAHGAALATGLWSQGGNISVMEVDNGLYTPTFSVILSNEAWAQISPEDRAAIRSVSGEALAHRSAAWDGFDNAFRGQMLDQGLEPGKADKALLDSLWLTSFPDLKKWLDTAEALGVDSNLAVNSYLADLRNLEDRLIYRGEETYVDQHSILSGGS